MRRYHPFLVIAVVLSVAVAAAASIAVVLELVILAKILALLLLAGIASLLSATFSTLRQTRRSLLSQLRKLDRNQHKRERNLVTKVDSTLRTQLDRAQEHTEQLEFRLAGYIDEQAGRSQGVTVSTFQTGYKKIVRDVLLESTVAADLSHRYQPVAPIGADGVLPSTTYALARAVQDTSGRRILIIAMGEPALWIAYALPEADIQIIDTPDRAAALTEAVAEHGFGHRIRMNDAQFTRPDLAHHYEPWFETHAVTGSIDTVILGRCDSPDYPALPLLARSLAPSAAFVLPKNHDANVIAAWLKTGWVVKTENPTIIKTTPLAHTSELRSFGLMDPQ